MISGTVWIIGREGSIILWEPRIEVLVAGLAMNFKAVEVVVDTGFTGALALPSEIIRELDLTQHGERVVSLAYGQRSLPVYGAAVSWLGQPRAAAVYETDGKPLIGNALLTNCRLTIDFRDGGDVTIAPLSPAAAG